ncbi:MAG: TlpA disulfide reductase family protein [Cocleimonas sp.]
MKKTIPALLLIGAVSLVATYFAIKNDVHKTVFSEGKITNFIEVLRDNGKQPTFASGLAGKIAPDFTLPSAAGGEIKLTDYKNKLVLLNFWASWCPPCRAEIPGFIKIQKEYKNKGFTILGAAIEDKTSVNRYVNDIKMNYPTAYGVEEVHKVAAAYGDPDGALPYSVLISKDQKILAVFAGFLSEAKLKELIEKNL